MSANIDEHRSAGWSGPDRYRRATYRLALAAQEVRDAAADLGRARVAPSAVEDLDAALAILAHLPLPEVDGGRRRPAEHVVDAFAGPARGEHRRRR